MTTVLATSAVLTASETANAAGPVFGALQRKENVHLESEGTCLRPDYATGARLQVEYCSLTEYVPMPHIDKHLGRACASPGPPGKGLYNTMDAVIGSSSSMAEAIGAKTSAYCIPTQKVQCQYKVQLHAVIAR
jgi:hypothetical protein